MTRYLDLEHILRLAERISAPRPRDVGLIASAVARPMTTVFGNDAYLGLDEKAAALLHSIARNHAFVDGNKRIAWLAAGAFYFVNGLILDAPDDPAYDLVIAAAEGRLDVLEIALALGRWTRPRQT